MSNELEKLNEAVAEIAKVVIRPENLTEERICVKDLFEALLGSVLLPEMVKLSGEKLDEDTKRILDEWTIEKVRDIMTPKVETKVETKVIERVKEVHTGERKKFRRLKDGLDKESRKKRDMSPLERKMLIEFWNDRQKMVGKKDALCVSLCKEINEASTEEIEVYPLQVGGFFSHLYRMALSTESRRMLWWQGAVKKGKIDQAITPFPKFSPELIRECQEYYEAERADEDERKKAHAAMRAARGSTPAPAAPAPSKPFEIE